jgi:serine/threonine protein kinase
VSDAVENATPNVPQPVPLLLEGYYFMSWLAATPLSLTRLYEDSATGASVVVKEIRPEICDIPGFDEVFEERMTHLMDMRHPNLLRLIAYGRAEGGGYFVIRECAEGKSLGDLMAAGGIDHAQALQIVTAIADALDAWHHRGITYGSVRACNIWIGEDQQVMLEAFPVCALLKPDQLVRLLGLEAVSGMPPEIISGGSASVQSDLFSLAALYFEMLTGTHPHGAISKMPPVTGLDFRIGQAVVQALSAEPATRQKSLAEFRTQLEAVAAGPATLVPQEGSSKPVRAPYITLAPVLVMLALVISVTAIGWHVWKREAAPPGKDVATKKRLLVVARADGSDAPEPTAVSESPPISAPLAALDAIPEAEETTIPPEQQPSPELVPEPEIETAKIPITHQLPAAPTPSPLAGDAYLYAAHFYYGEEIGMLKLQFGNAGSASLDCSSLAFQCAFSTDGQLDSLLPAKSGAFPEMGIDVAAGGFTTEWLGLATPFLAPGKKLWTKHTFRIDTSDPAMRSKAKYLIVKISPLYSISESNYLNNVIAIPLDHPEEWHSVTQDPSDVKPAENEVPPPQ